MFRYSTVQYSTGTVRNMDSSTVNSLVSFCFVLLSILGSRGWSLLCLLTRAEINCLSPRVTSDPSPFPPCLPAISSCRLEIQCSHIRSWLSNVTVTWKKQSYPISLCPFFVLFTLSWWGSLCVSMTLVAILAGAQSPAGPTMTGRYSG